MGHLLAEGEAVKPLLRSRTLEGFSGEVAYGDVTDPAALRAALQGVDTVIHLVAIIREKGSYTFEAVNVQGTANLVQAMQATGVQRLIHMSALGTGPAPQFRYTYSKWRGEEAVRQSGLHWTIFRPSIIFGEGFGFIDRVKQAVTMTPPLASIPGPGKVRFQPIWVEDVARCIAMALRDESAIGKTYEIGGPEHLTYEEILDLVIRELGLRRIKVHVPLWLLKLVVPLMGVLPDPPVTSVELAQLDLGDNITALDSVERSFGFRPARLADKLGYIR